MSEDIVEELKRILKSSWEQGFQEDKNEIYNLISYYQKISKINNYINEEEDLYKKYNINNNYEKISYEIKRIRAFVSNNNSKNLLSLDVINCYKSIINNTELLKKFQSDNTARQAIEKEIFGEIIYLEMKLGMKIGLYKEFIDYFIEKSNDFVEQYRKERKKEV